ncbi:recombinase family protein [Tistrella bauzanensis]|uniref:recombinase family protein n=1 Tax=Tistrella TaxID=171436 RepID=UPI0031F5F812
MRAAIYARYSSDRQQERSIDDQVKLCTDHVTAGGGAIVQVYADYAVSGASTRGRNQLTQMMTEARDGAPWDTVIAESLDRLSRDQEDIAGLFKRLRFAGVRLITVSEGEISELHIGLKGTMNALFLRDLADKVRRGHRGITAEGRIAAGLAYGYRIDTTFDDRGRPIRGGRQIVPEEADIIRRIYREYARGQGPRSIVSALNREGVTGPSGRTWTVSTVMGNAARLTGILHNPIYRGRLIYARQTFIKDPDSGQRRPRVQDAAKWEVKEVPKLRIISDDMWRAVEARRKAVSRQPLAHRRRPAHLLSGLIRCGVCDSPYAVKYKDRMQCNGRHDRGTCTNARTVRLAELESRTLGSLKAFLIDPAARAAAIKEYHEELARLEKAQSGRADKLATRLGSIDFQMRQIIEAIKAGAASKALILDTNRLQAERDAIEAEIDALQAQRATITLHPAAPEAYAQAVQDLADALAGDPQSRAEAAAVIRSLITRIEIHPEPARGQYRLAVFGPAAEALGLAQFVEDEKEKARLMGKSVEPSAHSVGSTVSMVAREGFEPPTKGL